MKINPSSQSLILPGESPEADRRFERALRLNGARDSGTFTLVVPPASAETVKAAEATVGGFPPNVGAAATKVDSLEVSPAVRNKSRRWEELYRMVTQSDSDSSKLRRNVMSTVSVTRLRVRSWRFLPQFLFHAIRSAGQVKKASGIQSATLLREDWRTYWTRTLWTDEAAMKKMMITGNHRLAMPKLMNICDEASVGRWNQQDSTPPSWDEVHRRMQQEGRASKVNNPSAAQRAFQIPAPRTQRFSEITLK